MSDYFIAPRTSFVATSDAIREKTGSQDGIVWGQDGFASTLNSLTAYANSVTGESDTTLSNAVASLADGYGGGGGTGLTEDIKQALLQIAQKVVYIDEHGQDYYDDLYDSLYPSSNLVSISAVYTQSGTVYETDSLDSLKTNLVVTALYEDGTTQAVTNYTLSGTLAVGTSTITVSYGGKTDTFDVTVTEDNRPWKSLSIADDFVDGTAWGSSYNSTYGQYCVANTSRCCYGKFEFYLETGYKYIFEHDSSNSSQKFGIVSGEKTTTTTTAIENHSSLSNKMPSDSGWQASGYIMTPSVDTYVAIQFNVTATALQNSGCAELRIRKVAV